MSLYRDLTDAALAADFGKNSLKIFNTLLKQTLGYGKQADCLTDKRLSQLSTVRLDRFRLSVLSVLDAGLFDRQPSDKFQWTYTIGSKYLEAHQRAFEEKNPEASAKGKKAQFFPPFLPKNSTVSQKKDPISGNESHTALDLESFLSYLPPLLQLFTPANLSQIVPAVAGGASMPPSVPTDLSQAIDKSLQSLADIIQQSIAELKNSLNPLINHTLPHNPYSSPISAYSPFHYTASPQKDVSVGGGINYNFVSTASNPTPKATPQVDSTQEQSPLSPPSDKQSTNQTENQNSVPSPAEIETTPPHCPPAYSDPEPSPLNYPLAIELPFSLKNYAPNLHKALLPLNEQQQKEVLYVFKDMQSKGQIKKSPSGLFIHLAKSALNGALSLPEAPTHPAVAKAAAKARSDRFKPEGHPYADDPNIQWGYSPISQPLDTSSTPYQKDNPYPYSPDEQADIDALMFEQRQADVEAAERYMLAQAAEQREKEEREKAAQCEPRSETEHQKSASKDLQILFAFLELGGQSYESLLKSNDFEYLETIYSDEIAAYRKDLSERRAKLN